MADTKYIKYAQTLSNEFKYLDLNFIPNAAHMAHFENKSSFTQIVNTFLTKYVAE